MTVEINDKGICRARMKEGKEMPKVGQGERGQCGPTCRLRSGLGNLSGSINELSTFG